MKTDTGRQPQIGMLTPNGANAPPRAQKERRGTAGPAPRADAGTGDIADATGGITQDSGRMRTSASSPADCTRPARIMIIDDHEISRAACRALLRTEGVDVIADLKAGDPAVAAAKTLRPDVAIVDVTPAAETGFDIARRLRTLPGAPVVVLTSSADQARFGTRLRGHQFIAKADINATAIARLAGAPEPTAAGCPT